MTTAPFIEYDEATAEVRAVYDDIMATRGTNWINNFWKTLANHPPTLRRTWESIKEVMAVGALDPLTKELVYLAVSVTNGCTYCIASHGSAAKRAGMTPEMLGELLCCGRRGAVARTEQEDLAVESLRRERLHDLRRLGADRRRPEHDEVGYVGVERDGEVGGARNVARDESEILERIRQKGPDVRLVVGDANTRPDFPSPERHDVCRILQPVPLHAHPLCRAAARLCRG